ncbi:MAG: TylF/MycF/NovP-related O-methyltransferase [Bryobacterales bacterium]
MERSTGIAHRLELLLRPARRFYKSHPGVARLLNRAIWRFSGPRKGAERRRMIRLFEQVGPYTLIGAWGLLALYRLCVRAEEQGIVGAFVECGVYRGGCGGVMAALAAEADPPRRTWLFDSFEGLPEPSEHDRANRQAAAGEYAAPIDDVRRLLFDELRLDPASIAIEKGWFDQTLPDTAPQIGPISVLRLDADLYESTRCCLENLYDQVEPGGFVIVDDYLGWPGCRKAVDEFLAGRGHRVEMQRVDPTDRSWKVSAVWFEKPRTQS